MLELVADCVATSKNPLSVKYINSVRLNINKNNQNNPFAILNCY